jgi:hypothetical protein
MKHDAGTNLHRTLDGLRSRFHRRLRILRRRALIAAAVLDMWREDLARTADGRVSIDGTKAAVKRQQQERMKLLGPHGRAR